MLDYFIKNKFLLIIQLLILFQYSNTFAKAKITWQFATMAPKGTPWYTGMENYAKIVKQETNGEFKIKIIPGGRLGSETNMFQQCKSGQIEMIGVNVHSTSDYIKELQILDLPFLIESYKNADKIFDSTFNSYINKILLKHNLRHLFWSEAGFLMIASKNKINNYIELKKKTIRILDNKTNMAIWNSMGIKAISIRIPEVYTSIQSGIINALESSLVYFIAASWFREMPYISITNHKYVPAYVISNLKAYNSLPDKYKKAMKKASFYTVKNIRVLLRQMNQDLISNLSKSNITIYYPDEKFLSEWKKNRKAVYDKVISSQTPIGIKLYNDIKKVLKSNK